MTISGAEVFQILRHRYPAARIYILDEEYELPTRQQVARHYKQFQRALKVNKLLKWTKSIWDCDDFAWAFKGGVNAHRAIKRSTRPLAIGWLCYEDAKIGPHSINNAIWQNVPGSQIRELEPQPGGGPLSVSLTERRTANIVIM